MVEPAQPGAGGGDERVEVGGERSRRVVEGEVGLDPEHRLEHSRRRAPVDVLQRPRQHMEGAVGAVEERGAHARRGAGGLATRDAQPGERACIGVVGRGLAYANAYEFALKLMETCYVVAERFSSADFLHGPVAMIERHFPVILFAPPGVMLKGTKDLIGRLHELRADTLAITGDLDAAAKCSRSIIMPRELDEFLAPIPYIIPAQLFAALLAEAKGLDPDAPRSLSKVTRTL